MKASELVGEIRKAARLYEVFKNAEEIATLLADSEKLERELQARVADRRKELEQVEELVVDATTRKVREIADKLEQVAQAEQKIKDAKELASSIMQKAREEAKQVVESVKDEVASLKESVLDVRNEKAVALKELDEVKGKLASLRNEMKTQRDQLLKVFN